MSVQRSHFIGKYVKKHSHVLFAMRIILFSHTAVKLQLTLMKTPNHPKNLGPTKSLNVDSDNCHLNVTICCLLSWSYPVKNEPKPM